MRSSLPVGLTLLLVVATAALPSAAASPAGIHLDFATVPLPGEGVVPVTVRLLVDDFMCDVPRTFTVTLFANTTTGITATFEHTELVFPVAAGAYFVESFEASRTVNLTMQAQNDGDVEITATFWAEEAPCMAPDGFDHARTAVLVRTDAARPPTPAPTEPTPTEPTPTEPTPEPTPSTPPTTPPDEPAANGTETFGTPPAEPTPRNGPVCGPEGNCGAIGDYGAAPAESSSDTPGLGLIGAVFAIGIGAFVLRRRQK